MYIYIHIYIYSVQYTNVHKERHKGSKEGAQHETWPAKSRNFDRASDKTRRNCESKQRTGLDTRGHNLGLKLRPDSQPRFEIRLATLSFSSRALNERPPPSCRHPRKMQPLSKPRGRGWWSQGEIKAVTLGNEAGTSNNVAWKFITVNTGASPGYDRCKTSDCSSSFEIRRGEKEMERLKGKNLFRK